MNWVPVNVSINAGPPAMALDGEREVAFGVGFGGVPIAKLSVLDVPPPGAGLCTAIVAVPAELRSDVGICAVSEVPDT